MQFRLNEIEIKKFERFKAICTEVVNATIEKGSNKYKWSDKDNFEFIFTPTGIGNAIKVRNKSLGISAKITDYDSW